MTSAPRRTLRPRVLIYPAIVIALLSLLGYLIATKSPLDVTILRSLGRPFVLTEAGEVENTMRLKLTNRTDQAVTVTFSVVDHPEVRVSASQAVVELQPSQSWTEPVMLTAPSRAFPLGTLDVKLRVSLGDGFAIDRPCRLLGPSNSGGTHEQH